MALSDTKIRNAKAGPKGFRLADGDGLHLFVTPSGTRSWRWRSEAAGKEKLVVLGRYPAMGLADARKARDLARSVSGQSEPVSVPTFEEAAREWHTLNLPRWKPRHADDVLASLVAEVFGAFGAVAVDKVRPDDVLKALRPIEQRGAVETARRVKQRCAAVFGFAGAPDPTAGLRARLAPLPTKGRRPALLDLQAARDLIAAIDAGAGHPATKMALRFTALTAMRPGEVNGALWSEIEGDVWRIPAERMKMYAEHWVPLAPAALDVLEAMRPFSGRSRFVFPNAWDLRKPISENAMGYMLIRLGYQGRHVPHGWRATFSSVMNERYPADRQVIDLMLAHTPKDAVERAYNRAAHTARRRELAELWAALLMDGAVPAAEAAAGKRRTI